MRIILTAILLITAARLATSAALPLRAKDISLMLRSGYSSEAVLRELSTRKFADTFDSAIEKQLTQTGASTSLIEALRNGTYQLSDAEIAVFQEKLSAQEDRAAEAVEQSKETAEQITKAPAASKPAAIPTRPDEIYRLLKGDLVYWHQGSMSRFDDASLERKRFFLFFISAGMSKAARQFTTQLIEYYNSRAAQHPEFEVIYFSVDRSPYGMETYMGQTNMPWPAVAFDKIESKATAMQGGYVHGIPALVLVDAASNVLSAGGGGPNDPSPEKVLADLDRVLAGGTASALTKTK